MLPSFMLHLFGFVKLCYFACLKHLISLIKSWMTNSKAGERTGGLASRESKKEERRGVRSEKRRKRGHGDPRPAIQPDTE